MTWAWLLGPLDGRFSISSLKEIWLVLLLVGEGTPLSISIGVGSSLLAIAIVVLDVQGS